MELHQSFDPAFTALIEKLRKQSPAELFALSGISPEQLDINHMARDFFRSSNRKGAATADHSIDPNANVSGRDVITFNYEVPKAYMKLNSLYNLWLSLRDGFDEETADLAIKSEVDGLLYINDSWDIGRPYCFNYSMYDIALEGLKMGGVSTSSRPRALPPSCGRWSNSRSTPPTAPWGPPALPTCSSLRPGTSTTS